MTGDPMADELPAKAESFDLEQFFPYRLSVLANTVTRALARLYEAEHDLTIAEWRLLAILARFGPISGNGVCERTAMDKVRVSRAVGRAESRGLVDRSIDPDDRRRLLLTLTAQGRAIHDRIVPLAREREAQILSALSEAEADALMTALLRLQSSAEAFDMAEAEAD